MREKFEKDQQALAEKEAKKKLRQSKKEKESREGLDNEAPIDAVEPPVFSEQEALEKFDAENPEIVIPEIMDFDLDLDWNLSQEELD